MKQHDFEWTSQTFDHIEKDIISVDPMTMKALGVVYKHFLVPTSKYDLDEWYKFDNYRHHLAEVEENEGDQFWIKPWLVGQWIDDKECIFQFEPTEEMRDVFNEINWSKRNNREHCHKRGAIFGIHMTIASKAEDWDAVFSFRLEDNPDADRLQDLPLRDAYCYSINGNTEKVEKWLDWAYKQSA